MLRTFGKDRSQGQGLPGLSLLVVKGPIAGISVEDVWDKVGGGGGRGCQPSRICQDRTQRPALLCPGTPQKRRNILRTGEEWIPVRTGLTMAFGDFADQIAGQHVKRTSHAPAEVVAIYPERRGRYR